MNKTWSILLVLTSVFLFSECKKENMDDEFSVFVGSWKCENRYIHQTYMLEPVAGTEYEHTLYIYSNGKYRIELPGERDNKGRIREIRHDAGSRYYFEFICNFFTFKRILNTGWHEVSFHEFNGDYFLSIKTNGVADYLYEKIN